MVDHDLKPSVLFALPCGLSLGGVTTWAVNLANELADRGYHVGMILHRPRSGDTPCELSIDERVKLFRLDHLPSMTDAAGSCAIFIPEYQRAIDELGGPVVALPAQMGDCHGVFAACTRNRASNLRLIGWAHLDSAYEVHALRHYARVISRFVGVSAELERKLKNSMSFRAAHISKIAYGVKVGRSKKRMHDELIRIAYIGRLERDVKRVHVLPEVSKLLTASNVFHELHVVGDGPERACLELAAKSNHRIRLHGSMNPAAVRTFLGRMDMLVLPSRAEGSPIVVQEAMERGCIPVACHSSPGITELIEDRKNGLLFDDHADDVSLARLCAACITHGASLDRESMSIEARKKIVGELDIKSTHESMIAVINQAADDPPRAWPADLNPMFTSKALAGSAVLPTEGVKRMRDILSELKDSRILLYGAGRHTIELLPVINEFRDSIVGVIDDATGSIGATVGDFPVFPRTHAPQLIADHVVISSHIHEADMWSHRGEFERAGMKVHRLYAD